MGEAVGGEQAGGGGQLGVRRLTGEQLGAIRLAGRGELWTSRPAGEGRWG